MIKLVLFDFDDTLCLTEEQCFVMENYVAQKMGFKPMTHKTHLKNWGVELGEAIKERIPGINSKIFLNLLAEEIPNFAKRGELDKVSESNLKVLETLKTKGKKLGIVTSREKREIIHLTNPNHPLSKYIDSVFHKGNLDYYKPEPKTFEKVLNSFNVSPNESIYIGDSIGDALSSMGYGLHFIALLESKIRKKEEFININTKYFANNLPEILNIISELDKY